MTLKSQRIVHTQSRVEHSTEYEVDTERWTCTCSVGRTGQPRGEPCKHQHAVANKYNLTAPNLVPYFNGDGRYLHAIVALETEKAGDRSFYCGITEEIQSDMYICLLQR